MVGLVGVKGTIDTGARHQNRLAKKFSHCAQKSADRPYNKEV